ncbi:MAG: HEAT repeat domain-containing protein [Acidobacteria bacterium]|nr:HEAT repeat domain-containing protein [Acidobacteriota bacterium]
MKGIKSEEFTINLGGKYAVYTIYGIPIDKGTKVNSTKIIRITEKEPDKWISKLSVDNLHRIIMNQVPDKYKDLRVFKPEDGIKMIGDAKIEASLDYLHAILKQPKERTIWPETLEAIGKIGGYAAQKTIQSYLYYEDLDIKIGAINAVVFLEPRKASRLLIKLYRNEEDKTLRTYILKKLLSILPNTDIQKFIKTEFKKRNPDNVLEMLQIIESHSYIDLAKDLQTLIKSNKSIRSDKQLNKEISTLLRTLENKKRSSKDDTKKASRPASTDSLPVHD